MKKISYFSYKGGSGRSSLLYNTIPYLVKELKATPKNPIVLLDLDLDSAGITFLLNKQGIDTSTYSIQEALSTSVSSSLYTPALFEISRHPVLGRCIPVGKCFGLDNESNNSVLFIPAQTGQPINKESNSNYDAGGIIKERFKTIITFCEKYGCAAVVFDTPAGDQLTANWAIEYSNVIATCMRITYQFRYGTVDFMKRMLPRFCNKTFVFVPNAVPTEDITIDCMKVSYEKIKKQIIDSFGELDANGNKLCLDIVGNGQDFFGVNEVKRFKIQEDILFKLPEDILSVDEKNAIVAYRRVATCLAGEE